MEMNSFDMYYASGSVTGAGNNSAHLTGILAKNKWNEGK